MDILSIMWYNVIGGIMKRILYLFMSRTKLFRAACERDRLKEIIKSSLYNELIKRDDDDVEIARLRRENKLLRLKVKELKKLCKH